MMTLDLLNDITSKVDDFIQHAQSYRFPKADVVAVVARTRNLTLDHAAGVVERRWLSPATAYDQIFLAENEWGNQIMRQVADEWFQNHPKCNFVSVYEHAGWSLGWHRSGQCVSSANGDAKFPADRPRPTHYSGLCERRPVIRPDIREVSDLSQYLLAA